MNKYCCYILLSLLCLCNRLGAQSCHLFVGSYNFNRNKEGIYVYRFDTLTGDLQKVSATPDIPNPSYLTLSPDGKHLFACTESLTKGGGSVSSFSFNSKTGVLSLVNSQPSGGENPVYVTTDKNGKWLVNANYTEGSVSVYPLDSKGGIGKATQIIPYTEGSIDPIRQTRAHVHCAVFSPEQDHIFFPDLGADKIRCYSFDASKDQPLSEGDQSFIKSTPGSGPRHFTFHPNGKFAYCIEEIAGQVSAYTYTGGELKSFQRIATHRRHRQLDYSSADIHISPDGLFLYASNRGRQNNIAIFSVNQETGRLRLLGYKSTCGSHPRNFTIDPSGKFLLVANQVSGTIVVFKRDIQTGLLTKTDNRIKLLNPSCLQMHTYED